MQNDKMRYGQLTMSDFNEIYSSALFPESPRWHAGYFWFSDMAARTVNRLTMNGEVAESIAIADVPSGIGFLDDGSMLVVGTRAQQVLRVRDGAISVHAELSAHGGTHLNDMVVSDSGVAYVGLRRRYPAGTRPEERDEGVVVVRRDGSTELGAGGLAGPNGSVVTPDGQHLLVAETYGQRITQFAIRDDGSLGERATYADVPGASPDGICLDSEGAVWVASPFSSELIRVAEGGEILARISSGPRWTIACSFGGDDRRTLFVLGGDVPDAALALMASASTPEPAQAGVVDELRALGLSGSIYTVALDVAGAGLP
jgi:sugar lactone lactonase YvrE